MTYYPAWIIHLVLRFDETLQVATNPDDYKAASQAGELVMRPGQRSSTDRAGSVSIGAATVQSAGKDPVTIALPRSAQNVKAEQQQRFLDPLVFPADNLSQISNIVPVDVTAELLSIRQAGKFSMTLDWKSLPIDPRLVRAIGVEIHLGTVSERDFSDGMEGTIDGESFIRTSLLKTRINGEANPETLLLYGSADTCYVKHGKTGSTVEIAGRDLRGLLIDAKVPPAQISKIKLEQPISAVVRDIIHTAPADLGLQLRIKSEFPMTEPIVADRQGLPRFRMSADGTQPRGGTGAAGGGDKMSYWDLITQYCFLVGAIPYFYGRELRIKPARTLFDTQLNTTYGPGEARRSTAFTRDLPFRDGDGKPAPRSSKTEDGGEEVLTVRRMVYGRDIEEFSFERKYGGNPVPLIKVVGTTDRLRGTNKRVVVQWPPADSMPAKLKADNEALTIPIAGVVDKTRLEAIAQDIYEEIGRGEMGGSCSTAVLSSFGGDNADPDLVRLRPTDPVEILVDVRRLASRAPLVAALVDHKRRSFDEEVQALRDQGLDQSLARVIVASSRSAVVGLINYFRVANVHFRGTQGKVAIDFDFQTYVVPRHREAYKRDTASRSTTTEVRKKAENKKGAASQIGRAPRVSMGHAQLGEGDSIFARPEELSRSRVQSKETMRARLKSIGLNDDQIDTFFGGTPDNIGSNTGNKI